MASADPIADALAGRPDLAALLAPRWTAYIPHKPTPKQIAFLMLPQVEALYGGAAGGGKALSVDTPIRANHGWTSMGSLRKGDQVLNANAQPCRVVHAHRKFLASRAYRMTFMSNRGDVAFIDSNDVHGWKIYFRGETGGRIVTTAEIASEPANYFKIIGANQECIWTIASIKELPPTMMRCITVDSEDGLFLAGPSSIPTHNSDALLMAALQYVDIPRYSAVIFRRSFADLEKAEALISRSMQWLADTDAIWRAQHHYWEFPSGARLAFSYLSNPGDLFAHQSSAYQFIGFDEATQFYEDDYTYMFSRLRKQRCEIHVNQAGMAATGDPDCETCREYAPLSRVPLRVRAATNPGGLGHLWVRNRFGIKAKGELFAGTIPERPYVPAYYTDNPYLDHEAYLKSLSNLDPVTREQLLRGDWGVSAQGRFRRQWIKRYSTRGEYIVVGDKECHRDRCRIWQTCDPAASVVDTWRRSMDTPAGEPSWSVVSTWLVTPWHDLIWWRVRRLRAEVPDVLAAIMDEYRRASAEFSGRMGPRSPEFVGIENSGLGIAVYQAAINAGLPVRALRPYGADKLVRATPAINRMQAGKIWLPESADWLEECESELFTWTAHPDQQADQIDTLAYAAQILSDEIATGEATIGQAGSLPQAFSLAPGNPWFGGAGNAGSSRGNWG